MTDNEKKLLKGLEKVSAAVAETMDQILDLEYIESSDYYDGFAEIFLKENPFGVSTMIDFQDFSNIDRLVNRLKEYFNAREELESVDNTLVVKILEGKSVRSVLREYQEKSLEIVPGDKIIVGRDSAVVKKIIFQDVYITDSPYSMSTADVEFEDENDNYRHWQSWSDGGKLITKSGKEYQFQKES